MDHSHIRAYFLAILTTLLTIIAVLIFKPFLVTVGLAAVFAVIFTPLHKQLQRAKIPEVPAAFLSLLIGVACVAVPLSFLSVQLFHEAQNVYGAISEPGSLAHLQSTIATFGVSLDDTIPGASAYLASLSENLGNYARTALGWGLSHAGTVFSSTLSFILQLFVFLITLYYFLKEGVRMRTAAERYSPLSPSETESLFRRLSLTIGSVVRGSLFIALIQGALTAIGFIIFGIPNAVLWGTIAMVAALIPSVGTAIVFIPGVLYLFFTGHTGASLGLLIYAVGFVGVIDNFLRPYLMGGKLSIHPLLILLSVLGGVSFFGPAGLFLGPLVISLLLGLLSIYAPTQRRA